ncbi:MAG: hypothetical protein J6A79_00720 [Clostridia bacterium]|nr:hypothetical protein [Clostridia bacterium]
MATSKISVQRLNRRDQRWLTISNSNVTGSANLYYNGYGGYITIDLTFTNTSDAWNDIGTYNVDPSVFSAGYLNIEGAVFSLYTNNGVLTLRVSKFKAQNYRGTLVVLKIK